MKLVLSPLPQTTLGIYGPNKDMIPERMRYLVPAAAKSFINMEALGKKLRVSDVFRTAEASLQARREKRGVQAPSRSSHNYGFAIDIDVSECMSRLKMTKKELDLWMESQGWFCHRTDHLMKSESWHFNWLGPDPSKYLKFQTTNRAACIEARLKEVYGKYFILDAKEAQAALKTIKIYNGEIDGSLGPLSQTALRTFQKGWDLPVTGSLDTDTQRLLAYVTAEKEIIPL